MDICPAWISEEYQIQHMLLKSMFIQQLSCCCSSGSSMILIQTEENRNIVIYLEKPVLCADGLKKLVFSGNLQMVPECRSCSAFSPELAFDWIHCLWIMWHPWSVKPPHHPFIFSNCVYNMQTSFKVQVFIFIYRPWLHGSTVATIVPFYGLRWLNTWLFKCSLFSSCDFIGCICNER